MGKSAFLSMVTSLRFNSNEGVINVADISLLGNLNSSEPLDLDIYKDAQELPLLPPAGRYTVQAPESFPTEAFGKTQANFLSVQIDPKIVSNGHDGYTLRYTIISAKPFKRSGVTVSQVGDYLRAVGVRGKVGSDPASIVEAVEQTANQLYEVDIDWRAFHKGTGFTVKGMTNFPSDGNGGRLPYVLHPTEKDPTSGEPVKVRANLVVKRFIAATS